MTQKLDSIEYWKCQFNIYHTEGSWVPLKRLVIWRRYFVKQSVHCISHANAWCEYWQRMKRIWRVWSADMWTRTIVNEMAKKWHTWNMWREWWRLLSCDWLDEMMSVGGRLKSWKHWTTDWSLHGTRDQCASVLWPCLCWVSCLSLQLTVDEHIQQKYTWSIFHYYYYYY